MKGFAHGRRKVVRKTARTWARARLGRWRIGFGGRGPISPNFAGARTRSQCQRIRARACPSAWRDRHGIPEVSSTATLGANGLSSISQKIPTFARPCSWGFSSDPLHLSRHTHTDLALRPNFGGGFDMHVARPTAFWVQPLQGSSAELTSGHHRQS